MKRLGTLALLGGIALMILTPSASAATTRAEYAAQANAICAVSLTQQEEVGRDLLRGFKKLNKGKGFGSKTAKKLMTKLSRGLRAVNDIARNEALLLSGIGAAPGDESLVIAWLAARNEVVRLGDEGVDQFRDFRRIFTGKTKFKDFAKFFELIIDMEATARQVEAKTKEANLYGGQLGATTCAIPELPTSVFSRLTFAAKPTG